MNLVFKYSDYPTDYKHDITLLKLAWIHYIQDEHLKCKLVDWLQKRKVIYYKLDRVLDREFKTEIIFGLHASVANTDDKLKHILFGSESTPNLRNEVHCRLKYESRTASNGLEDFKFELSLPINRDLCQHRALYYANEGISMGS